MFDFNRHPSDRELRAFSLLQFLFFLLVAIASVHHGLSWKWATLVVAASGLLGLLGLWQAQRVRLFYVAWMYVVSPIGAAISYVVLALVWLLVFTPVGLTLRLLGRDPLARRADPKAATYWVKRDGEEEESLDRYFRQY